MAFSFEWGSVLYRPTGFDIPVKGSHGMNNFGVFITDYIQCQTSAHSKDYVGIIISTMDKENYTAWGPIGRTLQNKRQSDTASVYAIIQSKLNEGQYKNESSPYAPKYIHSIGVKILKLLNEHPLLYGYGEMVKRTVDNWVKSQSDASGEEVNYEDLYADQLAVRFKRVKEYLHAYPDMEIMSMLQEKSRSSVHSRAKLLMSPIFDMFEEDELWYSWSDLSKVIEEGVGPTFQAGVSSVVSQAEATARFSSHDVVNEIYSGRMVSLARFKPFHAALISAKVSIPWRRSNVTRSA